MERFVLKGDRNLEKKIVQHGPKTINETGLLLNVRYEVLGTGTVD